MSDEQPGGPPEYEASPDECEVPTASDVDHDMAEDVWTPFDAEYDHIELDSQKVMGEDGMPTEHAPVEPSPIPVFSPDTLVCAGRFDKFVLRGFNGRVLATFGPSEVKQAPSGIFLVSVKLAGERYADQVESEEASVSPALWWSDWYWALGLGLETFIEARRTGRWLSLRGGVEVEPIRPPCRHYIRQATQLQYNPDHKEVYRLCSLRRSMEGAMMTVGNLGVWACDGRDPRDIESEQFLAKFDEDKEREGKHRTYTNIFAGFDDQQGPGGIFNTGGGS